MLSLALTLALFVADPAAKEVNSSPACATKFDMQGTEITIPCPKGYFRVTAEMTFVNQSIEAFATPEMTTTAVFLPDAFKEDALSGEPFAYTGIAYVSIKNKPFDNYFGTTQLRLAEQGFADLDTAKTEKAASDFTNDRLEKRDGVGAAKIEVKLGKVIRSTSNSFTVPMAAEVNGESNVVNFSLIAVKGKVLFAYYSGPQRDSDRVLEESNQWVDQIVAANPSNSFATAFANLPTPVRYAIIGGILGAILALCLSLASKLGLTSASK